MANWLDLFPEYMLDPEHKEEWILLVRQLPIPPARKKQLCINYAQYNNFGAALTRDLVEAVLGVHER